MTDFSKYKNALKIVEQIDSIKVEIVKHMSEEYWTFKCKEFLVLTDVPSSHWSVKELELQAVELETLIQNYFNQRKENAKQQLKTIP